MTTILEDRLEALLKASIDAWHVPAEVVHDGSGKLVVVAKQERIEIGRAPEGLPFRWSINRDGRTRGAASVVGVLRAVRSAVDPDWRPVRLRIAPPPVVPP